MENNNLKTLLDQRIEALQNRVLALQAEIAQAHNELEALHQLEKVLGHMPPNALGILQGLAIDDGEVNAKTQFQKIAEFLVESGDSPKTIPEIMEGTGISRSSVAAVLYRTHVNYFIKSDTDSRLSRWRLRTPEDNSPEDIPF